MGMTAIQPAFFETLWDDGEFVLSRGDVDGQSVLTVSSSKAPSVAIVAQLEQSLALRDEIEDGWAVRPTALAHVHGRPTLMMRDPGGEVLASLINRQLDLTQVLRIAIGIASSLGRFHASGLLHRDLKPSSILVDPESGSAWLSGLGHTSRSKKGRRSDPEPPRIMAGTRSYIAPEQTRRMDPSIDSRSNLYAFLAVLSQ